MFFFLLRLLGALIAAAGAFLGVLVIGALIFQGDTPTKVQSCLLGLVLFAAMLAAFVGMFRRLGRGRLEKWRVSSLVAKRRAQAVRRQIAPRATLVATVLGNGSHTTATLRVAWEDGEYLVSVAVAEGGPWRTVFTARFHPEVEGQVVASGIRPDLVIKGHYSISTSRVGHEPAWWEVLAYIPGDWEEELNSLWERAKEVQTERKKDRFGIE
jgi:hypothetical protein